jgi:sulfur-oxidizing protein SoxY
MMALFESPDVEESDKITIDTPKIAENGAIVPVEITVNLPNVESITIISEKNPTPLIGQFEFADNAEAWVKTRIKMDQTSNIVAVVKADGKLYAARRKVKVTLGGCG